MRRVATPVLLWLAVAACGDDATTSGAGGAGSTATTGGVGGAMAPSVSSTGTGTPIDRVDGILALTGDATAGAALFTTNCGQSNCHGNDGSGSASNAPDLAAVVPPASDEDLTTQILVGSAGDLGAMPGLAIFLDDQGIADVIAYCRQTFP